MKSHFLEINNNKAIISQALIDEINKKDDEKLERLQFIIEVTALKNDIKHFHNNVKLTIIKNSLAN